MATPPPTATPSPPGVLVIHGSSRYAGQATDTGFVAQDIAAAGYYVVAVNYELARCGLIPGQPCHEDDDPTPGSMVTREVNDIKAFVNALRADPHVDSTKIGVVGGSAGATHAVWVALDTTDTGGDWPYWKADARPQCAAMLSADYDFSDRTPRPGFAPPIDSDYVLGTENYVNSANLAILKLWSPISLVTTTNTNPLVPLFLINSWFDDPPSYHQMVDMICALKSAGVPDSAYQTLTIPDSALHSFHYWNSPDGQPGSSNTIKDDVIAFLNAHLK